ncbi:hypothetical protein B0H17DRAFT_1204853 [Mycena rosella]|uniref:Uncharacterized protein n=1 Tax=Mycena rosella TaxID=1033263 RepID=A0AAD7GFI0_MYCRO|nr:hypothetical protein B0H17DRAFT_1204853 [Mycena rosella]
MSPSSSNAKKRAIDEAEFDPRKPSGPSGGAERERKRLRSTQRLVEAAATSAPLTSSKATGSNDAKASSPSTPAVAPGSSNFLWGRRATF